MTSHYRGPEAPTPSRPRKVGVCFIVDMEGGALVDRRKSDGSLAFAGGTLEEDESVEDALARELFEETGLEALRVTPWPAHRPIRDAYLAFDGEVVVA